jgi:hypothetical protein
VPRSHTNTRSARPVSGKSCAKSDFASARNE